MDSVKIYLKIQGLSYTINAPPIPPKLIDAQIGIRQWALLIFTIAGIMLILQLDLMEFQEPEMEL